MCRSLSQYATLIHIIRENSKTMPYDEAVDEAVKQCIHDGILSEFLQKHRSEVKDMFLTEYNAAKTMNLFEAEWRADERKEMLEKLVKNIMKRDPSKSREEAEKEAKIWLS